jgi:tetratricopeptide (TPR) repeat protein
LTEALDRLLQLEAGEGAQGGARRTERRIELWLRQAANSRSGVDRARCLVRAAHLAESIRDIAMAVEHFKAALAAWPIEPRAVDGLLRLLSTRPGQAQSDNLAERLAVHAHAAEHSADLPGRVAHLERVALLQEELLEDPSAAAATYERVLRLDPHRRSAIEGLTRSAWRIGDPAAIARALLERAEAIADPKAADAARLDAAQMLSSIDPDRALALVEDVLSRDPADADALRLAQDIHATAGRWSRVDAILAARIEQAREPRERVDLLVARAELQHTRLHDARSSAESVARAAAIDGSHPAVREAMRLIQQQEGDVAAQIDALEQLAANTPSPAERVQALAQAAELAEHVLRDDARAAELYAGACTPPPADPWVEDRRMRVLQRLADADKDHHRQSWVAALEDRLEKHPSSATRAFELALALAHDGADSADVAPLLDLALGTEPTAPHVLRVMLRHGRMTASSSVVARAFALQADGCSGPARLAALWELAALARASLEADAERSVVARILEAAPEDRAASDAALRLAWPQARASGGPPPTSLLMALRARLAHACDDTERLWARLALALVLDPDYGADASNAEQALSHAMSALRIDGASVLAAALAVRLGDRLGDVEAWIAGTVACAELSTDPKQSASLLAQAAAKILSARHPELGVRAVRLERAGALLERALEADPEALSAVGLLAAVRGEDQRRDRLLHCLRSAFERARTPEAVANLGTEVARAAALDPPDRLLCIAALRRVLSVSPGHTGTLRMLANAYTAQGAWGDAIETLEELAARLREPRTKAAALVELADLLERARPQEAERVLLAALDVWPTHTGALTRLIERRGSSSDQPNETAAFLRRLAEALPEDAAKAAAWVRLGELEQSLGNANEAVACLRSALAIAPAAHEARVALANALAASGAAEEAGAVLLSLVTDDPPPLAQLADPRAALATLETTMRAQGHAAEAAFARDLQVVSGIAKDSEGESRSQANAATARSGATPTPGTVEWGRLREAILPGDTPRLLLDLAGALSGADLRALRADNTGADVARNARERVSPSAQPMAAVVGRVANWLGVSPPSLVISETVTRPVLVTAPDAVILSVPRTLLSEPEPVQAATAAGLLVPLALGLGWAIGLASSEIHGLLCGAGRQVVPGYAGGADMRGHAKVDDFARRVAKAIGRSQKRSLAALAKRLAETPAPTLAEVQALEGGVARAGLRAAYVFTRDLPSTLRSAGFGTTRVDGATGKAEVDALLNALTDPLALDVIRFALALATRPAL